MPADESRPPQTPWAALIHRNRLLMTPRPSIREMARKIGMSPEWWGHIERSYRNVKAGVYEPVPGDAAQIANMAWAVGVTPEDLDTTGRHAEAADLLRDRLDAEARTHAEQAVANDDAPYTQPGEAAIWMIPPYLIPDEDRHTLIELYRALLRSKAQRAEREQAAEKGRTSATKDSRTRRTA